MLSPTCTILHLDADAFFASVEQRDDAKLRGRPVAVGTGVVASCSYESRRFGVRTGMRLAEARRLCRELIVLPGEYPRYEQTARRMQAICAEQTPQVEMAALDDFYLDLAGCPQPERAPETIRTQIRDEIQLSVSIGLGTNKMVARVATKEAKPGRQVSVTPGQEQNYLAPWPTRVLPGVGPKIQTRLDRINVQRVAEVAGMPLPLLHGLFGRQGRLLHDQSHGRDPRPVLPYRPPQSISRRNSFDPPISDLPFLNAMLDYLVERAVSWLRFQKLATRGLTVNIRYGDYESDVGRVPFAMPTDKISDLKDAAHDRFGRLYHRRLPLRLLGVELSPLVTRDPQPGLFPDADEERERRLEDCKAAIRQRFGFTALLNGSNLFLAQRLDRDRQNFHMRTPCLTR